MKTKKYFKKRFPFVAVIIILVLLVLMGVVLAVINQRQQTGGKATFFDCFQLNERGCLTRGRPCCPPWQCWNDTCISSEKPTATPTKRPIPTSTPRPPKCVEEGRPGCYLLPCCEPSNKCVRDMCVRFQPSPSPKPCYMIKKGCGECGCSRETRCSVNSCYPTNIVCDYDKLCASMPTPTPRIRITPF